MAPSRKYMGSVMANGGFKDGITIHTATGITIEIPQEQITRDGHIRKHILARTKEMTRENAEYLATKNVKVYVGGIA